MVFPNRPFGPKVVKGTSKQDKGIQVSSVE